MFVRGGVYKVVHEAMGGTLAKFSVSALMFDYVLTGPIRGVSAGLYLGGLINEIGEHLHHARTARPPALFRGGVRRRRDPLLLAQEHHRHARIEREGAAHHADHHRDGGDPDCLVHRHDPEERLSAGAASHCCRTLSFTDDSRWAGSRARWRLRSPSIAIMIGLGHSLLAMSGVETPGAGLPRNRPSQAEEPGARRLVIFIYSMVFTSLVSFFAVMIIPDSARPQFLDNLIGGLSMYLIGPLPLAPAVPRLRRAGGHADAVRRGQHRDHRLQRRAQPRGRGWRAARLVPPSAPEVRHHLAADQH